jgi:hypothetical protein
LGDRNDWVTIDDTLVEFTQLTIFLRNRHAFEIGIVSYCLEVAADEQQVNIIAIAPLEVGHAIVGRVQGTMAATFYRDLL